MTPSVQIDETALGRTPDLALLVEGGELGDRVALIHQAVRVG